MEELKAMGCRTLVYLVRDNILHRVITIHVDDFQLAGDEVFQLGRCELGLQRAQGQHHGLHQSLLSQPDSAGRS